MDHDEGHMGNHMHVGLTVDLNADGYLCVRHNDGIHVHVDNTVQ
jgi:hypothetical protein